MREGLHKIVSLEETIVAISTPNGRSALGIVRLSGNASRDITNQFFKSPTEIQHRSATLGTWAENGDQILDEVVVTYYKGPHSYTGEDLVEISAHGNPLVLQRIVECARSAGARLAAPGEFTLRAVAHGKMDLIQAEAVREFIEAQTDQQARTALRQMGGSNSKRIRPLQDKLIDVIARLEAGIDFAEDDVAVPENGLIANQIDALLAQLEGLQRTFNYGRVLKDGLQVTILGKPNVGKSSLFNRMLCLERSIVTEIPGTTRDVVTERIDFEGVPLRFSDTAGIRETTDIVENLGLAKTLETVAGADLVLIVLDGSAALDESDDVAIGQAVGTPRLTVINKCDLAEAIGPGKFTSTALRVSAKTGEGIPELWKAIGGFVSDRRTDLSDDFVLTSSRQNEAILKAIEALRTSMNALSARVPHEMVLLDLYEALSALDQMTGEVVTDDILARIFSTFCVGK